VSISFLLIQLNNYDYFGCMDSNTTKKYINTTIDASLLTDLRVLAARRGVKINVVLEEAIRMVIEKYSPENLAKE
jgi:hypothetical protein